MATAQMTLGSVGIRLLGYGSAVPDGGETLDHTSGLMLLSGCPLLIDFPRNVVSSLHASGVDPLAVRDILLTHGHADHMAGLPSLAHQCQQRRLRPDLLPTGLAETGPIRIYTPRAHAGRPGAILEAFGLTKRAGLWPLEIVPLEIDRPGDVDDRIIAAHSVRFIGANHAGVPVAAAAIWSDLAGLTLPTSEHGPTERTDDGGRVIPGGPPAVVWSGDTEPCDPVLLATRGAGLVVHDCQTLAEPTRGHTAAGSLAERLLEIGPPRGVVPVHLTSAAAASRAAGLLRARLAEAGTRVWHPGEILAGDGATIR